MTRYCIKGVVIGLGPVQHVVRAADPSAAWERFQRAHSAAECIHIETRRGET